MIVLDTDILIWIFRGQEDIKEQFEIVVEETNGYLYITPIQIAEIYAGLRDSEKKITEEFLQGFLSIVIDEEIGKMTSFFINKYRKSHSIELADALIAACVKIKELKLWTLNKRHYPMLEKDEFYEPCHGIGGVG